MAKWLASIVVCVAVAVAGVASVAAAKESADRPPRSERELRAPRERPVVPPGLERRPVRSRGVSTSATLPPSSSGSEVEGPVVPPPSPSGSEVERPTTTFVRPADVPGESIVGNAEAEVLGPPLRIEEPATEVLGTQVTRPREGGGGLTVPTGGRPLTVLLVGAGLLAVGVGLQLLAGGGDCAVGAKGRGELELRWLEPRRREASVSTSGGLVLRFLEVPVRLG